jgi:hypothetical protein
VILKFKDFEIKLDDSLAWLEPYIRVAKRMDYLTSELKEIRGYYVTKRGIERQQAGCTKTGARCIITILKKTQTYSNSKNGKFKVDGWIEADENYMFEETLDNLAHEITHIKQWDHTADRHIAEKKLQLAFAKEAKKQGYQGYDD